VKRHDCSASLPPEPDYVAAVEERLAEMRGAPLVLSSRDWERVRRWRERGIPLTVVLRALGDVLGPAAAPEEREPPPRLRPLAYCERAVEQRWKSQRDGAVGKPGAARPTPVRLRSALRGVAREAQAAARRARKSDPALARPLADLALRLRDIAGRITPDVDPLQAAAPLLVQAETDLRAALRGALAETWEALVRRERERLAARLQHMSGEAARATAEAAVLARLRRELGVPTFDPGALHARLQRRPARRRLTPERRPI
jgi:hypothetical protein